MSESDCAKSVRLLKSAMTRSAGKTYKNAVELQKAEKEMEEYRRQVVKLV